MTRYSAVLVNPGGEQSTISVEGEPRDWRYITNALEMAGYKVVVGDIGPVGGQIDPQRAVWVLRAKAGELENRVHADVDEHGTMSDLGYLTADVGLIAGLLADHLSGSATEG